MGNTADVHVIFGSPVGGKDDWIDSYAWDLYDEAEDLGLCIRTIGHIEYSALFVGLPSTETSECWSEVRLDLPMMMGTEAWYDKADIAKKINSFIDLVYESAMAHDPTDVEGVDLKDYYVTASDVAWYAFPCYG